jgi:hypothetical protein
MTTSPTLSALPSSPRSAVLLALAAGMLALGVWTLSGCASEPRVVDLETVTVERLWRRSVGEPRLDLPFPRISPIEGGVELAFRPSGTIDRSTISRQFVVVPTATVRGTAARSERVVDLQEVAAEAIRVEYPALESNAEAVIGPSQIDLGEVVVDTGGGRSLADVRLSIEPEAARIDQATPAGLAAENVTVVSVRLVRRDDPTVTLLEGRRVERGGVEDQRFEFAVDGLGEGDCRRLRALFIGDYAIIAECEIRTGRSVTVPEERIFAALAEREWLDPIRRAASQRLEAIAATDPASSLAIEFAAEKSFARRGEMLPPVLVTNVSRQPVLDLRTFTVAYQIRTGTALAYVGSGIGEGEPCLCPGETLEILGADQLDPCGEAIRDAGDGLIASVSTSAIDSRTIGPIPVEAAPRFGARLLPPRVEGAEVLLEATAATAVPQGAVEVRLLFGEAGEIRSAFPAIPEGGAGALRLPADLDAEAAALWAEWRAAGGRVDAELLEASLWDCEDAAPARQAFRIGR